MRAGLQHAHGAVYPDARHPGRRAGLHGALHRRAAGGAFHLRGGRDPNDGRSGAVRQPRPHARAQRFGVVRARRGGGRVPRSGAGWRHDRRRGAGGAFLPRPARAPFEQGTHGQGACGRLRRGRASEPVSVPFLSARRGGGGCRPLWSDRQDHGDVPGHKDGDGHCARAARFGGDGLFAARGAPAYRRGRGRI